MDNTMIVLPWPITIKFGQKIVLKFAANLSSSQFLNGHETCKNETGFKLKESKIGWRGRPQRLNLTINRRSEENRSTGFYEISGKSRGFRARFFALVGSEGVGILISGGGVVWVSPETRRFRHGWAVRGDRKGEEESGRERRNAGGEKVKVRKSL